jgi:hypothetical protein
VGFFDCDLRLGAGDINSRTQLMLDYLPDIDGNVPTRTNPDLKKNAHGGHFITFLKDNRSVFLNGRVTPEHNNCHTRSRGKSHPRGKTEEGYKTGLDHPPTHPTHPPTIIGMDCNSGTTC